MEDEIERVILTSRQRSPQPTGTTPHDQQGPSTVPSTAEQSYTSGSVKSTFDRMLASVLSASPFGAATELPTELQESNATLRNNTSTASFDTATYSLIYSPHVIDENVFTRPRRFLSRILAGFSAAPALSAQTPKGKGKRKARSSHYFDAREEFALPLDGEEGELIDDEGCFVDARETIGMDIIMLLPSELALNVLSHLDLPSVIACSSVNQYWRLVAKDSQVWRTLFFRNTRWSVNAARLPMHHSTSASPGMDLDPPPLDWQKLYRSRRELDRRWADPSHKPKEIKLVGHSDSVYCLELDSRLNILVTGSRDRSIKFWDLTTGALITTLTDHHAGSVLCLKIDLSSSPMGFMVSGSSDRTAMVWDVDISGWIRSGCTLGVPSSPSVQTDLVKATVREVLGGHAGGVLDLKIDSEWIVGCSKDSLIRVWSRRTLELYATLNGHDGPVNAVGLQGGKVVSASGDGNMILWDLAGREKVRVLQGHDRGLACVEFKDKYIISGSNDRKIKLWSVNTGECLATLAGHDLLVRALSFDPSLGRLVSASYDKTVKVWDVVGGGGNASGTVGATCVRKFADRHTSHIFDVKFDVRRIVSSSHDQTVVISDFGEGLDTSLFT